MDHKQFQKLLHSSKRYEMNGSILIISDYYTGEKINLDLSRIDEEMLNNLSLTDDELEEME